MCVAKTAAAFFFVPTNFVYLFVDFAKVLSFLESAKKYYLFWIVFYML